MSTTLRHRKIGLGLPDLRRRAPAVAIVAAIVLLFAALILALAQERAHRVQKIEEVTVEGRLLALIAGAAVDFDDRAEVQRYVEAFRIDPDNEASAVYDARGMLFAGFARPGAPAIPTRAPATGAAFAGNRLIVTLPVTRDGKRLGSIYLDTVTEPVGARLQRYLGLGLLVTMAALVVAVLGMAHSALGEANAELEKWAGDLAAANRQLRTQVEERERAEEALWQSQKMEAIGRLTGGVAHDFNNLMTIVEGNLELIERLAERQGGIELARLRRLIDGAQRGLARGEQLTRQLLAFSRQEPLAARVVEVNPMIADFAPLVQRAVGEAVELRLELGQDKWLCRLDPAQFEAAILNLAINARDAMEEGGRLTIATRLAATPERGPQIVLTLSDTGSGMPPEVQRRIFEPFYTTKPVGKGSGLGLAQVWAFVAQSGGRIEVDSAPGRGTVFRLHLPLSPEAEDANAAEGAAQAERGGSETILVVEDEDDVREVARATLARLGYRTLAAHDGRQALAILAGRGDVDLLFADCVMPSGLGGAALAREALRLRPPLKVLLTSGYLGPAAGDGEPVAVQGFPLIAKPYRPGELAARIREILDAVPAAPAG
jgi:signal transduction histidine kinase